MNNVIYSILLLILLIFLHLLINKYIYNKLDENNIKYTFIHIPKSGGTSITKLLKTHIKGENYKVIHLEHINPESNVKYIIWIRNPMTRFVSAFNYVIKLMNKESIYKYLKKDNNFIETILKFKSANDLAENIYTDADAFKLLTNDSSKNPMCIMKRWWKPESNNIDFYPEDIFKGISWYLDENFLNNNHQNILFCGQLESNEEDVNKLCKLLKIKNTYKPYNLNKLKLSKYLSPLAKKNLRQIYSNDYKCLEKLVNYGLLSRDRLNKYY